MKSGEIHGLWGHLPLLVRANSKDSVEYILQALWRTRQTGLDAADRQIFCQILQLQNDSELDPLLVCLRSLIRRCVYESVNKEDIQKLFPSEVLPELQRLLTLLLQKFHREWHEDVLKDQQMLTEYPAFEKNSAYALEEAIIDFLDEKVDELNHHVGNILVKNRREPAII